jgi:hypothetical protein
MDQQQLTEQIQREFALELHRFLVLPCATSLARGSLLQVVREVVDRLPAEQVSAGFLRGLGFVIPSHVPNHAMTARSGVRVHRAEVCAKSRNQSDALGVRLIGECTDPFTWVD